MTKMTDEQKMQDVEAMRKIVIDCIEKADKDGLKMPKLIEHFNEVAEREGVELPTDQTAIIQEALKRGWV